MNDSCNAQGIFWEDYGLQVGRPFMQITLRKEGKTK